MAEPWAHSGGHLLADHLRAVAALAGGFSQTFDAAEPAQRWAYLAPLAAGSGGIALLAGQ